MWEIILGLTIGPYLFIWDSLNSKSGNSGHTAGLCEGFMLIYSVIMITIHLLVGLAALTIWGIFN